MIADTRPGQAQARKNPGMEEGDVHEVPPLAEQLLALSSGWERKNL